MSYKLFEQKEAVELQPTICLTAEQYNLLAAQANAQGKTIGEIATAAIGLYVAQIHGDRSAAIKGIKEAICGGSAGAIGGGE